MVEVLHLSIWNRECAKKYFVDPKVLIDLRKITGVPDFSPKNSQEICERLLVTCYMGTDNSSKETKERANLLAKVIGRCVLLLFQVYLLILNLHFSISLRIICFPKFTITGDQ